MQPRRFGLPREAAHDRGDGHRIEAARRVGGGALAGHAGQYIEPVLALRSTVAIPGQCALCAGWGSARVCAACLVQAAPPRPRCRRCAIGVPEGIETCGDCVRAPPPFERTIAALDYAAPWPALIARFKFHDALDLATVFAQRLVASCRAAQAHATLIVPVPLDAQRLRERGYNQAWELARRVGETLGIATDPSLLLRIRATPHQLALPLERRAANVQGAFAVEPRRRAEVAGRVVAVVDDVMTTGATVAEITRVLLAAQASSVQVWTLARTPRPHDA